jgi:hypothetical protein
MLNRLLCFFKGHVWRESKWWVAHLKAGDSEPFVMRVCQRCRLAQRVSGQSPFRKVT